MKLPVAVQTVGLVLTCVAAWILFGVGWCVLTAGAAFVVTGTVLELEQRRG